LDAGEVHTDDMGTIETAKTDVELVEASRRGELDAFGHLVARYQNVVTAVGYSSTGDRVLGEDVAQDTFLAAWRQLDRVRDVMRLGPWLCGIARNLGRKAKKRTRHEQLGEPAEVAASSPSAFDELARVDTERVVNDALAKIPEAYREVLVLYYREDHSIRDVAQALGISEAAVMQRLTRGRRYLADRVTVLVERSLEGARPRRDLVAAVLAAIAAFTLPSRVDASPVKAKGSTMLKLTLAASALAVVGTTAYLLHSHHDAPAAATSAKPLLHYGAAAPKPPALGPTAPRHITAARQTAVGDLGYLPANADVVFGIDMARIQSSALWQQMVAPRLANASGLHEFVTACGFDPIASLTTVSIGVTGLGSEPHTPGVAQAATLVIHGFDKAKAMACLTGVGATAMQSAGFQVTVDGGLVIVTHPDASDLRVGISFIDPSTAVVVIGEVASPKAAIEQVAAGNSGLQASPAFADLFADIDSDDPLWFVVGPTSPVWGHINDSIASFTSIRAQAAYGSIDVSGSLAVQAGLRLASPAQVTQLVTGLQSVINQVATQGSTVSYFDQLDVNADGNDVIIGFAANAMQLANVGSAANLHASATSASAAGHGTLEVGANVSFGE
jgi:RNA polymerase sigma factor (sigma-70 family)